MNKCKKIFHTKTKLIVIWPVLTLQQIRSVFCCRLHAMSIFFDEAISQKSS